MLLERLKVVDEEVLVHQNQLSWVDICPLEVILHSNEIQHLGKSDPAYIEVKLVCLCSKVTVSLVFLKVENVSCFLDPAAAQQEVDLVLGWDLLDLMNHTLDDVCSLTRVV